MIQLQQDVGLGKKRESGAVTLRPVPILTASLQRKEPQR